MKPEYGHIYADGEDITSVPTASRNIGMVFQDYALFPHLNVHQNIAYGLRTAGKNNMEIKRRVNMMLDLSGLPGYGGREDT